MATVPPPAAAEAVPAAVRGHVVILNSRLRFVVLGWLLLGVALIPARAGMSTWWTVGVDNDPYAPNYNPTLELGADNGQNDPAPGRVTRLPGDPAYNAANNPGPDDDFYFAGVYPTGFNRLTSPLTVPNAEPFSAFKRGLTTTDRTNRIHFHLAPADVAPTARLRLSLELDWGGIWIGPPANSNGIGFGPHETAIRWRTASSTELLWQGRIDRARRIHVEFSATGARAVAGANTVEIVRVGPDVANHHYWVQFDYVRLEGDRDALRDDDRDGLPLWWELENGLSDSNASDATSDRDFDGLTAVQEFAGGVNSTDPNRADSDQDGVRDDRERQAGSDPLSPDTDGDLLSDAVELNSPKPSSPLSADGDGDGASDTLESRTGTDPKNPGSKPNVFRGGIGFHFVTLNDLDGVIATNVAAGVVPQVFWNETQLLIPWNQPSGGMPELALPVPGSLVRSDGTVVAGMTVSWTSADAGSTGNRSTAEGRLLDGFIRAQKDRAPARLVLNGIPFARYDLYVYVGNTYRGGRGTARLEGISGSERPFRFMSAPPESRLVEVHAGDPDRIDGNYVRYSGLTGASVVVQVEALEGDAGLHGVQIIDSTLDADASGIPDWYEMQYRLEPGTAQLASADSDGDGLKNIDEFRRGTDPWVRDTDGDGLGDLQESAAQAVLADSDGDGLSDAAELGAVLPSDPARPDTDGDGYDDREEVWHHSDPGVDERTLPGFGGWVPVYRSNPTRWEWNLPNVQLVWDHGAGMLGGQLWSEEPLLTLGVSNADSNEYASLQFQLRQSAGAITYQFASQAEGAFSASGSPGSSLWFGDPSYPPFDLRPGLGFSGFGAADLSDPIRFHFVAVRGEGNSWTLTFEIINQATSAVVASRTFQQCTAAPKVDNGTAVWRDFTRLELWPTVQPHAGIQVYITPKRLGSLPAFAAARDTDRDGIPDAYESAHGLDPRVASDALADLDGDGIPNRDEWQAGTDPQRPDTDGDGLNDRVELFYGSNPRDPSARPLLAGTEWTLGEDLDGDGLSDVWQARYGAFGLAPEGDADGDGATNAAEAAAGTDPHSVASQALLRVAVEEGVVVLSWPRVPGKNQEVLGSTDLQSWALLNEPVSTDGVNFFMQLASRAAGTGAEFFRLATGDIDLDADGLSDWAEANLGSDPLRSDSLGQPVPKVDGSGRVTGSVSGDYAAFAQRYLPPSRVLSRAQAARLLQQATFGPTPEELDRVQQLGVRVWLEDQFRRPPTLHRTYIDSIVADFRGPRTDLRYHHSVDFNFVHGDNGNTAFARAAISGPDQLRQRVAFALSQILVISRRDPNLENKPVALADYYDLFVKNAFGNYGDILRAVSLHPLMGRYLSHVGNQKARPEINQYPDENYAREVMQLFTIGLWELNPDGTRRLDGQGAPIPTYSNREITELARVFTGLWFGGQYWGSNGWNDEENVPPMDVWAEKHDFGEKTLVRGAVIPARAATPANGLRDIHDALRILMEHPNTAPFVSRQLIQFLVTSNPSRDYVRRVASVFADNGSGRRGDLEAVVRAILLDAEARDPRIAEGEPAYGRLKEPVHRAIAIARVGQLDRYPDLLWWDYYQFYNDSLQVPMNSPSVFNFFRPGYAPPGVITQAGLVAPVFQITQSTTCISFPNRLWNLVTDGIWSWNTYQFAPDYAPLVPLAARPGALVDELNLMFCSGQMTAATRAALLDAVQQVTPMDPLGRVRLAIYLAAACPEGAVQR